MRRYIVCLLVILSVALYAASFKQSLEHKIAQLCIVPVVSEHELNAQFIASAPYNFNQDYIDEVLSTHPVGGIIFLGFGHPDKQVAMTNRLQALSCNLLLVAQDLVGVEHATATRCGRVSESDDAWCIVCR